MSIPNFCILVQEQLSGRRGDSYQHVGLNGPHNGGSTTNPIQEEVRKGGGGDAIDDRPADRPIQQHCRDPIDNSGADIVRKEALQGTSFSCQF